VLCCQGNIIKPVFCCQSGTIKPVLCCQGGTIRHMLCCQSGIINPVLCCQGGTIMPVLCCQGGKGDAEYLAAFQQIVMPIAYEVRVAATCLYCILLIHFVYHFLFYRYTCIYKY